MLRCLDMKDPHKDLEVLWRNLKDPKVTWAATSFPGSLSSTSLVAAGYVTTQNWGGKRICWAGRVAEHLIVAGIQILEQLLKTTCLWGFGSSISAIKNTSFLLSPKYSNMQTFVQKQIQQLNGAQTFQQLPCTELKWNQWIIYLNLWIWR